jgi:pimeloyl-ACP methyl ester carboxylesterase
VLREAFVSLAILLSCATASAEAPAVAPGHVKAEFGTLDGAAFRIDVPAEWNGGLVVFYHGYAVTPVELKDGERISPMFDGMLARGFAVIQSAYSATGWAVEEGAADTERLRTAFVARHGAPKETFAAGMSMGGTLVVMAIESHPDIYAGALSLCGALEPSDRLMQRDFALLAAFDHYFPDVLGPLVPVSTSFLPTDAFVAKVAAALRRNPKRARALQSFYGVGDLTTLPDVISFNLYEVREMQQRAKGNPFGNADLVYTGSGDDFALNAGVRRYRADPEAAARMARFYTPTGKLERPLLALHDTGDPLVPASTAFEYALAAARAGRGEKFVQQFVNRNGHCVFTPAEIDRAFGELLEWVRHGKTPASGPLPPS